MRPGAWRGRLGCDPIVLPLRTERYDEWRSGNAATPSIPAGVVAEWQRAGELLAETEGTNAIDATVVASAAQRGDVIVTGDADDLRSLAAAVRNVRVEALG